MPVFKFFPISVKNAIASMIEIVLNLQMGVLIVVIISQCTHISNHHVVHFNYTQFCQLYLNKAEGKIKISVLHCK